LEILKKRGIFLKKKNDNFLAIFEKKGNFLKHLNGNFPGSGPD